MKSLKTLYFTTILLLTYNCLLSQDIPSFHFERILTDFRGVVTNGQKTICYGDYGIMTYTLDAGKTWEQLKFNDKHKVMKIVSDGQEFYGVTDYLFFRSYNNDAYLLGKTISFEPKIIDMTLFENSIFILMKDSILRSDKELNLSPFLALDTNYQYSELKTDGSNLYFILDDKLLLIFNLSTREMDTVDLIKDFNCYNCTKVSELNIFDGSIYVQISYEAADNYFYYNLLKSGDGGKTWFKITNHIVRGKSYKVIDNEVYFLKAEPRADSPGTYFSTQFYKVDSSHFDIDSSYFTILNENDGIERYISWQKTSLYNDFTFINEDTIIAVGNNNLISVSYDKGRTFQLKSFFYAKHAGYTSQQPVRFLDEKTIVVVNGFSFFKSENAGITWLPQKFINYNNDYYTNYPDYFYVDRNGMGFAKYRQINSKNDSSALITNDYGENFTKTDDKDLTIPYYNEVFNSYVNRTGLDLGDVVLFAINPEIDSVGKKSFLVLRYDKSMKLLDTARYYGNLRNMTRLKDNSIIALYLNTYGENKADSNGNTDDYSYHYYLNKSTDKGKIWDSLNIKVPIRQKLLKNGDNYYYGDILVDNTLEYGDFIFYPTRDNIIYRYDYVSNHFDSLFFPDELHRFYSFGIFGSGSKIFLTSKDNNNIYYTDALKKEYSGSWDSISPELIFNGWDNYDYYERLENKDAIISAHMFNDSTGFLVLGKSQKDRFGFFEFKINLARIRFYNVVNVEEYQTENSGVYIWHSNPYPLPGQQIIKSNIHWTRGTPIQEAIIDVFDINGSKLKVDGIKIVLSEPYSGILTWDCSNVNSGIYIIQISLMGKSISFPAIVTK